MNTMDFLSTILVAEGNGHYCLFRVDRDDKYNVQTYFYDTIQELRDAALAIDPNTYSVYTTGFTFNEPARKQANAQLCQSFFLDVDCGDDKPYKTKQEGFDALRAFMRTLKLPKPLLVDSGNGLQAWWLLDKPITKAEWQPIADAFKDRCVQHKFAVDSSVTADAARLLRVVGTHNRWRYGEHKGELIQCTALGMEAPPRIAAEEFGKLVNNGLIPVPKTYMPSTRGMTAVMERLAGNKEASFAKIIKRSAAGDGCQQILDAVQYQDRVDEPMWRAVMSIAKFCKNGEKNVHKASMQHPEYDYGETQKKAERIKGPYLCERFMEANPAGCEGCPHKGLIKSPITLGSELKVLEGEVVVEDTVDESGEKQLVTIPNMPAGYARGTNGGIYAEKFNKNGEADHILIAKYDFYLVCNIDDAVEGQSSIARIHFPMDGIKEFLIPMNKMFGAELFDILSRNGMPSMNIKELGNYLCASVDEIKHKNKVHVAHRQFGWTEDNKEFVIGDRVYRPHAEPVQNFPSAPTAQFIPRFSTQGTMEGWRKTMDFFNLPDMETYQLLIYMSFGSPLMQFTGLAACGVHIHSVDSGFGKTTIKQAMASVWGNSAALLNKANDTQNSRLNRMETFHNLPFLIDEMTNKDAKFLSDYAYTLVDGMQRNRLSSSANKERHRGMPWACITVTSANESMIEKIAALKILPEAEAMRVLEVQVFQNKQLLAEMKGDTDALYRATLQNFGFAGPVFIQYVLDNKAEVEELLFKIQKRVDKAANLSQKHRFWSASVACALTGGYIATKLGLLTYDWEKVFARAIKLLTIANSGVAVMREESTPSSIISDYWEQLGPRRLVINRNNPDTQMDISPVAISSIPQGGIAARYEPDTKHLWLYQKDFKNWCVSNGLVYGSFMAKAEEEFGRLIVKRIRMSAGTPYDMSNVTAIRIDVTKLEGFDVDDSEDRTD